MKNTCLLFSKKIEKVVFLKAATTALQSHWDPPVLLCFVWVFFFLSLSFSSSTNRRGNGSTSSNSDLPSVGQEPHLSLPGDF